MSNLVHTCILSQTTKASGGGLGKRHCTAIRVALQVISQPASFERAAHRYGYSAEGRVRKGKGKEGKRERDGPICCGPTWHFPLPDVYYYSTAKYVQGTLRAANGLSSQWGLSSRSLEYPRMPIVQNAANGKPQTANPTCRPSPDHGPLAGVRDEG